MDNGRRSFLRWLGKGSVVSAFLVQMVAAARAFVPNVLYEPPTRFKVKRPKDYPEGVTYDPERRLFVVRQQDRFHVVSAVCTHLGCTVQWKAERRGFGCPCHGSAFTGDGEVTGGPAPRSLAWYAVSLSPDGFLEVDRAREVARGFAFTPPGKLA